MLLLLVFLSVVSPPLLLILYALLEDKPSKIIRRSLPTFASLITAITRAIFQRKKLKIDNEKRLPQISVELLDFTIDPNHVRDYARCTGFDDLKPDSLLYAGYFQCITSSLQMLVLTHPRFPINLLGSVNTRNVITVYEKLESLENDKFHVVCQVNNTYRVVKRGIELDVISTIFNSNNVKIWSCVFSLLSFQRIPPDMISSSSIPDDISMKDDQSLFQTEIRVPATIGRVYAGLCRDYNFIHLSDSAAKLLGFKRSIAHGMWVVSSSLALIKKKSEVDIPKDRFTLEVVFKRPILTASSVNLEVLKASDKFIKLHVIDKIVKYSSTVPYPKFIKLL